MRLLKAQGKADTIVQGYARRLKKCRQTMHSNMERTKTKN